ncbi:hypothetical protein CK203_032054 [Vitis vinifera]|uniref:Aminotransferase-like plant mobile domain-containing protein n=2 Tax=Vitis vinifera TaxID=29760 RepID=A0A438FN68_VITVI|nr:hypothetical protein CK203_032054 [Vitis vinifera]
MNIRCRCSGCRFLSGIHLLLEVKKDVIRELGFGGLLQLGCKEVNLDLCFWLIKITNIAYSQLELFGGKKVSLTCHDVGMTMGIPHSGRKLIVEKASVKASQMPSLQDIESMMVGIDDMEEFKQVFLIFACATLLAPTSRLEGSHSLWYTPREQLLGNINWGEYVLEFFIQAIHEHRRKENVWIKGCLMFLQIFYFSISNFPAMYVELTTPRIATWNDFLVKQHIKLELEMLGGFSKVEVIYARMEATQRQITDAQSHLNSLIASYNRDVKVLRTRFTSSHYRTDEGQPSNFHEHVNESGVLERPNVEDGVFLSNEDPLHPGPRNMLVLVQSCMNTNVNVAPQASEEIRPRRVKMKVRRHRQRAVAYKSPFVQLCVSKYKRLTEEKTHVADYVFDESKDPREMLCAYGGYGVTREQLQCLVGESFIDILEICGSMSKSTSKSTFKKRLGSYCVNLECCNQEVTDKLIEDDEFDADQNDAFKNFVKDNVREAKKANRQAKEARKKAL